MQVHTVVVVTLLKAPFPDNARYSPISHDLATKPHEMGTKTHDSATKSHDSSTKSHDALTKIHDFRRDTG